MKFRLALLPLLLLLSAVPAAAQWQRDDLWVTNGDVTTMQLHGNSIFIGGTFTRVGPAWGTLAAVHGTTGAPTLGGLRINGTVNALAPDGSGGFYIGGSFSQVLGQNRMNAARIDAVGNLKPWAPQVDLGVVNTMVLAGDKVYLGGSFSTVNAFGRMRVAAVDTTNGQTLPWIANADGDVYAMGYLNGALYVGGAFTIIGGAARNRIACLDPFTGAATTWNPNSNGTVYSLAPYFDSVGLKTTVYAGGTFTSIGGQARTNLASLDATVGSLTFGQAAAFNPAPNAVVRALAAVGPAPPVLYVGGDFTTIAAQPRNRVASFNGTTLNAWNPNADGPVRALQVIGATTYLAGSFTTLGGQPRANAGSVNSSGVAAATGWDPEPFGPAYALGSSGNNVWIGGTFSSVGGVARSNLAEIDLATGAATSWNPSPPGYVNAIDWVGNYLYYNTGPVGMGRIDAAGVIDSWVPLVAGKVMALAHSADNTLYVGGDFVIDVPARTNLAAFSTGPTPALLPWAPTADNLVTCLAVDATHVYIGGWFSTISGHATKSIGRVDFTGNHQGWTGPANLPIVNGLALTDTTVIGALADLGLNPKIAVQILKSSGSSTWYSTSDVGYGYAVCVDLDAILIGGHFSQLSGQPRSCLAKVDHTFGLVYPTDVDTGIMGADGQLGSINSLLEHDGVVYIGGDFDIAQGWSRGGLAGLYTATTAVEPAPHSGAAIALRAAPNPARGTQALVFDLAAPAAARVTIHNVAGRVVRVLHDGILPAGPHRLEWDGRTDSGLAAAPGIYFVRLEAGDMATTTKVLRID